MCARSIESQGGCCKFQWSIGNDKTAWIRLTSGKEKNVCLVRLHESDRRSFQLDESHLDVSDLRIRSKGRAIVNWSIFEHKSEEKEEARACTWCWTITRGNTGGCLFRRGEFLDDFVLIDIISFCFALRIVWIWICDFNYRWNR